MAKSDKPQGKTNRNSDLTDSPRDNEKLKAEETTIDLPDVKDIPGQEFVHPPNPGEYADTTISSSDEEGDNIWGDEETTEDNSIVTNIERKMLRDSANEMDSKDEQQLRRAELDNTDEDGDPLNERSSVNAISGSDLDTSGVDEDDSNEEIGEEDEENNDYSLGGDDNSINEERSGV
ncbi:MAG TPA: hypothetical protein VGQ53_06305 [Chitinophagaceae bacterium]|jgi:hypothetical protein|nr:hypothetical protein [Chitinophagaceae bacterium]